MAKKLVSWDDVALALPAVVMTKLLATFDALGAAAAVTPASIGAATPASVTAAVTALVNAAPGTMDTLGEIAAVIASDESAAAALLTSVATKATIASLTTETNRATAAEVANTGLITAEASTARAAEASKSTALTSTTVKTGAYTAAANQLVPVDATTAPITVTLPTAPVVGSRVTVKKIDASVNLVTIASAGSDVFNVTGGVVTKTLTMLNQASSYQYATGIWYAVSDDIPLSGLDARYVTPAQGSATFVPQVPQGSSSLRTFKAALASARAGVGACDILTIGDSITEGTGPASGIEGRWASRFHKNLRTKSGITGGRGYVPAVYAVPGATQLWALSGGASNFQLTYGLGKRAARLNAAGHTATLTVPIGHTDVDLFVTASTTAWGWFTYTVDGGPGIPASPVSTAALSTATLRDAVIPIATGLNPAAPHTIVVTWNSSGNVYLTGAMLYNADKTTGIRLWDGAHNGQMSNYFATAADPWNLTVNTIQPDLVCIMLGRNDWSGGGQSVAQMRTNLETLIANLRAQCTIAPSIVLMVTYGNIAGGTPSAPWQEYVDAMKALALADGDVAVLDLFKRLGTITNAGTNGLGLLVSDFTHPSDIGAQMMADALMDFVAYPLTA